MVAQAVEKQQVVAKLQKNLALNYFLQVFYIDIAHINYLKKINLEIKKFFLKRL